MIETTSYQALLSYYFMEYLSEQVNNPERYAYEYVYDMLQPYQGRPLGDQRDAVYLLKHRITSFPWHLFTTDATREAVERKKAVYRDVLDSLQYFLEHTRKG